MARKKNQNKIDQLVSVAEKRRELARLEEQLRIESLAELGQFVLSSFEKNDQGEWDFALGKKSKLIEKIQKIKSVFSS